MRNEQKRIEQFLEFMRLPMGIPIVSAEMLEWLVQNGFFRSPASTKHHGSHEGGLFDHSIAVAKALVDMTVDNDLQWKDPRSPYIVGMFHDLCKIDSYKYIGGGLGYDWNDDTLFKGHGVKSVALLASLMKLTDEEVACIWYHMGAYTDKSEWNDYGRAVENFPNVLWTHHADMIAARVQKV